MGKSPGRWIKAVLFGKKPSKSNLSKKTATEKDTVLAAKAPSSDRPKSSPPALDQALYSADETGEISGLATGTANLPNDGVFLLPGSQDAITKGSMEMGPPNDAEKTQQEQEQAVTKIQATYRSYLARRAFRALKGIIRLQAVVRGHLVRRQAVVTLYCMRGIVNLQALVRGRKVRFSEAGLEVQKRSIVAKALDAKQVDLVGAIRTPRLEKLSANTFVVKLLASTPTSVPLHLQYDPMELNSAWSWLDRWSSSRFWEPLMQPKKARDLKSQRKQANKRSVELEKGRPKRVARRVSTINSDHSVPLASEYEKPKHSMRKSTLSSESVQENPQKELERVKHNLRKVSVSNTEANNRLETVTEKSKHISRKVSTSLAPDVLEHIAADASEKPTDLIVTVSKEFKEPETNIPLNSLSVDEPTDVLHNDHPVMEVHNIENSGEYKNTAMMNEELASKEDQIIKESQKVRRRRSLPLTQEYAENASQNNPTLPSYMAATKSAKAKARGQGSLKLTQDEVENGFVRRHSLSSAPNGKVTSPSPRMQRLAHSGSKGGSKSDRSLSSSRDCQEKAEWRR